MTAPATNDEKHHGRPWWRWLLWGFLILLIIPVMAVLVLQLEPVQDFIRRQGEQYLQKKLHTTVRIGYLRVRGWQYLELRNVYVADTSKQALFYSGNLKVRYNLLAFLNNELRVNGLEWDSVTANVYRNPGDTTFNYQFIVDAFVTKDTIPDTLSTKTGTTLQFLIKDVTLKHVALRYADAPGGMTAVVTFQELHVDPDDLLVDQGLYSVRGLKIDGLKGFFTQDYRPKVLAATAPPPASDTASSPFHLILKKLEIENSSFLYTDQGSGLSTGWKIGKLQLLNSSMDIDSTLIQVGELSISNTGGTFTMNTPMDTSAPAPADSTAPNTWRVLATKTELDHINMRYDNNTAPAPRGAGSKDPNYNHLFLKDLVAHVGNINYNPDTISAVLHRISVQDKSGFGIKQGHFDVLYTPTTIALRNLLLETNRSILRKQIVLHAPSWSTISDNLDLLQLQANLDSSHITLGEFLPFVPDSRKNPSMKPLWDKEISLTTTLKGSLGKLIIESLHLTDNKGNRIDAKGEVGHVTDVDHLYANLPSIYILSGNKALRSWLPPGTMPDTPRLPEQMIITGSFLGGMKDMKTQLDLKSNAAVASLTAHLINITDSVHSSYDLNLASFRVLPGYFLYDTTIGWISGRVMASGKGYTFPGMLAKADAHINEATYNKYTYHDISVKANIDKQQLHAEGQSNDSSINLTFNADGTLNDTTLQSLKANAQIVRADLYTTHLYSNPLDLKGNMDVDFSSLTPSRLDGNAFLTGWQIATNGQVFVLDTISLLAAYKDQQYLSLTGPFGFINANGNIDYTKIGPAFGQIINKPLSPYDSAKLVHLPAGQLLTWNASLTFPRSLQAMAPTLRMEKPLLVSGRLNSDSSLLVLNAALPKLSYDSILLDSLAIAANIMDTALKAQVSLADIHHKVIPLYHTSLTAAATAGKVNWDLLLDDLKRNPKYKVGGFVEFLPDNALALSLKPDLLLNRQKWQVDENNRIHIHNGGPDTAHIRLSYNDQSISIQTKPDSSSAHGKLPTLETHIENFKLSTITALLAADTLLANGVLNAQATVRNLDQSPLIDSKLTIDSLTFRSSNLGTLKAAVTTPQANQYSLDMSLQGNDNDLQVKGTYDSTINATVDINQLNVKSLESFTFGNMNRMHGTADGHFKITGTTDNPKATGNLHFNDAGGTITYIGASITMPDENIVLDEKGVQFNKFVIADSLQNELILDGRINTKDYSNYNFNLNINSDNFMILGKQVDPQQLYYGPAFVDTRIKIRGNLDLPRVDAYVKLRDKSNVTVTLPSEEPGVANREGVIIFVDKDNPLDSSLVKIVDSTKLENPRLKGINFSGNAEITPQSTIRIIIDPVNGDFVEAKGTASINATLDASSKMSLTGRYEISEGKYEMSLNQLIKRSFSIEKGSSITFSGDATDADLDITAKYTVNAQAADLVADQLTNLSQTDRNKYKQKLPFYVYLHIKGNLLKPDITFELDMPETEQNAFSGSVYNRIKQINQIPSELNKQVMGLLVLNSFIPEDPMAGEGSSDYGVSNMARQSVSKILSQQLNNLAGNLIKGVDLNFDLESDEDYSTGAAQQTTNLKVGASKSLFNDRLSVSIGSNVMLEGESQANPSSLVGDVSVEYKLTRDGRYRVRVYQRQDNTTVIEGQVVETGVAFALIMDYDNFREIFQRAKREKKSEKLRTKKKTSTKK